MRGWGIFLLIAGAAIGSYAFFFFDATVSTEYARIYNVGLLQRQQNLLFVAGACAVIGVLMVIFGGGSSPTSRFAGAIARNDVALMSQMIDSGQIDPNGRGPGDQVCWLRYAVSREALQACELLFKKGADPARPDGFTRPLAKHVDEMLSTSTTSDMIRALFANPPERESRPANARQDETSGEESASVGAARPKRGARAVSMAL